MSSGMVGFRLNQKLTTALGTLPGSSHTVVKALFLLQLCQDRAALDLDPQLLVPDVRAVLRYLLPTHLRRALEAWLEAGGETSLPPGAARPPQVVLVNPPTRDPFILRTAVRDDGATGRGSAPGNLVRDGERTMNSMHDVLDEGEEF